MPAENMTRRQRVLAAVNRQIPDRMPIDLGMHFSTGISAFPTMYRCWHAYSATSSNISDAIPYCLTPHAKAPSNGMYARIIRSRSPINRCRF
ncbi:MAG: hypothetical protein FWE91_00675 [Defluviitaleaceae bacterium]|nr:hypothetical protein [Defluviitaleaceae bacterium]